jgi:hypothetical protein
MCSANEKAHNRKHLTRRLAKQVIQLDCAANMVQRTVRQLGQFIPGEETHLTSGLDLSIEAIFLLLRNLKMATLLIGR